MAMLQVSSDAPNSAYGTLAAAWAQRLLPATPIIATDLATVPHAFFEAARRRKRGDHFSASVVIEDARARCALYSAASNVLIQFTDYDERARALDAVAKGDLIIGDRKQRDMETYDPRSLRSAVDFLVTADLVVVRSSVERESLSRLLDRRFLHVAEVAPLSTAVPLPGGAQGSARSIVLWAPDHPAEACGIFAFALEEFEMPALIVCAGGQPAAMRAGTRFVTLADASAALAEAAIIVDTSLIDPGAARALAAWGVPLAAASCSGAADWVNGIAVYDPWNHRSIQTAVANALGAQAPYTLRPDVNCEAELARALDRATPATRSSGPLVSAIVPTLNRRDSLRAALASISDQTYRDVELVIVNDGGPPIECASINSSMLVHIIDCAEQRGLENALNVGIRASKGKYVVILADDDLFCPNHIADLVQPLERIGGNVAHSIELRDDFVLQTDASYSLVGHCLMVGEPAGKTTLQVANPIGGPSLMFTRSAYDSVRGFDAAGGFVSDLEMWMQLSEKFDFVHVDRVTAVMSCRNDPTQVSSVTGAEAAASLRYIYSLHPSSRQGITRARDNFIRYNEMSHS